MRLPKGQESWHPGGTRRQRTEQEQTHKDRKPFTLLTTPHCCRASGLLLSAQLGAAITSLRWKSNLYSNYPGHVRRMKSREGGRKNCFWVTENLKLLYCVQSPVKLGFGF